MCLFNQSRPLGKMHGTTCSLSRFFQDKPAMCGLTSVKQPSGNGPCFRAMLWQSSQLWEMVLGSMPCLHYNVSLVFVIRSGPQEPLMLPSPVNKYDGPMTR
jgi:hypothetical protein